MFYLHSSLISSIALSLSLAAFPCIAVGAQPQVMDASSELASHIGKGKWTVVNIWAPNCPPCREEMPELVSFHDRHTGHAGVVGVAIGFPDFGYADSDRVDQFIEDYLIDFTVIKADGSISWEIDSKVLEGLPTTYLYTPQGKLVAKQVGAITSDMLEKFIDNYSRKNKLNKSITAPSSQ